MTGTTRVFQGHFYPGTSNLSACGNWFISLTTKHFNTDPNLITCARCKRLFEHRQENFLGNLNQPSEKTITRFNLTTPIKVEFPRKTEGKIIFNQPKLVKNKNICPYCKSSSFSCVSKKSESAKGGKNHQVLCNKCKARGPLVYQDKKKAISAWKQI